MELIEKYFARLTDTQKSQFNQLEELYRDWNEKINVISRKDIDNLMLHHVLHSLALAKLIQFKPRTDILDVGTGGGFPGIPLAILFPEANFYLVDSIGKKIKVVREVADSLGLKNVKAEQMRVESLDKQFDFIVSRAVTAFPEFVSLVKGKIHKSEFNEFHNGIFYLKGGEFGEEISQFKNKIKIYEISDFFEEEFFDTKKIIYMRITK